MPAIAQIVVVNPLQTGALRHLGVRKTKTDRWDALVLADLVRIGRAQANHVPDDALLQLRELTRFRWELVDQVGDAKRRLLTVLDRAASAGDFAAIPLDDLTAVLTRASRKRLDVEKANALQAAARESLGLATLALAAQVEVRALLAQLRVLEDQVATADASIAPLLATVEAGRHLTSIPGAGPVLAATILAEIGDVRRFPNENALVACGGQDPSVFESGAFQGQRQHISKRGSPYLRRALYIATYSGQRRNADLRAYLQRKLAQGKPCRPTLVATSHKLLARVYAVLKKLRPYAVRDAH